MDMIVFPNEEPKKEIPEKTKRAQSLVGTSSGRPENDFYRTSPEATLALLAHESFPGTVWEPACGDGAIATLLASLPDTTEVISTDLVDRGFGETGRDFFKETRMVDHVVTNPPYGLAEEFVRHSLASTTGKTAMLLKLQFLEGQKRQALFRETPLKTVYVFSKRISMFRNGDRGSYSSGMICFAWFVWEHGYVGEPVIRWL